MTLVAQLSVEEAAALAAAATFCLRYARNIVVIRRWEALRARRRERAARKVVMLDFLDEPALDGLADHLLIEDPPHRLRRIELERSTSDELTGSVGATDRPVARLSRRRGRDLRELYRGIPEPAVRLDAVLDALEGPVPVRDRIVATNEQLVRAAHDAAIEHEREFNERFRPGEPVFPPHVTDAAALDRAIAVTARQALRDCLLVWLHGQFTVSEDGEQLVLEGDVTASATMLHHIRFPVRVRVASDRLSSYGSRLVPGATVPLELLGTATQFGGEPPRLTVAPVTIFARSALHLPDELRRLPLALNALPRPLRSLAIGPWVRLTRDDRPRAHLGPQRAARRTLRGRGTPQWWLDG